MLLSTDIYRFNRYLFLKPTDNSFRKPVNPNKPESSIQFPNMILDPYSTMISMRRVVPKEQRKKGHHLRVEPSDT